MLILTKSQNGKTFSQKELSSLIWVKTVKGFKRWQKLPLAETEVNPSNQALRF